MARKTAPRAAAAPTRLPEARSRFAFAGFSRPARLARPARSGRRVGSSAVGAACQSTSGADQSMSGAREGSPYSWLLTAVMIWGRRSARLEAARFRRRAAASSSRWRWSMISEPMLACCQLDSPAAMARLTVSNPSPAASPRLP